jgi:hypothetical protein
MNARFYLASVGVLALSSIAASAPPGPLTAKRCVQLEVPVPVVATNYYYDMPSIDSNIDAVDWTLNVTTYSNFKFSERVIGPKPVNCTFKVHAQLCVPSHNGAKADILQIATQGRGFDKRLVVATRVQPRSHTVINLYST